MHLMIGTRGNQESVDLFFKELSSQKMYLPFINTKTGAVVNAVQAVHVRPMQIHEIVFPKEYRDTILTSLFPNKLVREGKIRRFLFKLFPFFREIPKDWDASKKFYVEHRDVEIMGICMKDDKMVEFKQSPEAMKQIGLDPKEEWEVEAL